MSDRKLTVLITNLILSGRSGTEIVTRDLALGLRRRGHRVIVYTHAAQGPIADELRRASIPVVSDIGKISSHIDIIHGHHTPTAAAAMCRYPQHPALFLAHDFFAWHDTPPAFGSLYQVCAVDTTVAHRLTACHGYAASEIEILPNSIDLTRFKRGPQIGIHPRHALAFAKNTEHLKAIREACEAFEISLDVVGQAVGNLIQSPENSLAQYDLVFASALTATEAMACGRAVIACDGRGLAGLVRPSNMKDWRAKNFGLACLSKPLTAENIRSEITLYDRQEASIVSDFVRGEADQEQWLDQIECIYERILASHAIEARSTTLAEAATHLELWAPARSDAWPWMLERDALHDELLQAHLGVKAPSLAEKVMLSTISGTQNAMLVEGFALPEEWGVWTNSKIATLLTRAPCGQRYPRKLTFEVQPFLTSKNLEQNAWISINNQTVAHWRFRYENDRRHHKIEVTIPQNMESHLFWISFEITNPYSPSEGGISGDTRALGLGLISFSFE